MTNYRPKYNVANGKHSLWIHQLGLRTLFRKYPRRRLNSTHLLVLYYETTSQLKLTKTQSQSPYHFCTIELSNWSMYLYSCFVHLINTIVCITIDNIFRRRRVEAGSVAARRLTFTNYTRRFLKQYTVYRLGYLESFRLSDKRLYYLNVITLRGRCMVNISLGAVQTISFKTVYTICSFICS